jgi:hypothetical protein
VLPRQPPRRVKVVGSLQMAPTGQTVELLVVVHCLPGASQTPRVVTKVVAPEQTTESRAAQFWVLVAAVAGPQ